MCLATSQYHAERPHERRYPWGLWKLIQTIKTHYESELAKQMPEALVSCDKPLRVSNTIFEQIKATSQAGEINSILRYSLKSSLDGQN